MAENILWIVVPPRITKKQFALNCIGKAHIASSEEEAWNKFLGVALKKEAYINSGFKAVEVDQKILTMLES